MGEVSARTLRASTAYVLLAFIASLVPQGRLETAREALDITHETCWEDQACWRCEEMGNHRCGPR